jgi:hypothetical protein
MMIFVFVVLIAAAGTGLYLTLMYGSIPGAVDERLGKFEPLPANLGQWLIDDESELGRRRIALGRVREVRTLYVQSDGLIGGRHFLIQARTRDVLTGEVVDVEPERRAPRRRKHEVA